MSSFLNVSGLRVGWVPGLNAKPVPACPSSVPNNHRVTMQYPIAICEFFPAQPFGERGEAALSIFFCCLLTLRHQHAWRNGNVDFAATALRMRGRTQFAIRML